jgi:hypothetical protein
MNTYRLQLQHTAAASGAGNWAAVAAILTADIRSQYAAKRSYNDVLAALGVSDMEHTLAAFSSSEIGRDGRQMLVTVGLSFSHPTTVALVNQLQAANALRPGVAAKLLALGSQTTQIAPGATADQCRDDWEAGKQLEDTQRAAAVRSAKIASLKGLDSELIVDSSGDIDSAIATIRTFLLAFGGWN